MLRLLIKTLGIAFYEQHAGLFLVICYLLFGAVEGSQLISYHFALLIAICSSPVIWLVVFALWMAYAIKCYLFIKQRLALSSFNYVYELAKRDQIKQYKVWLYIYTFMLLPILCYAVFIVYISLRYQYLFSLAATLIGLFTLLASLVILTFRSQTYKLHPSTHILKLSALKVRKPFWTWPLFYLWNDQPLMFFVCKFVSLVAFKSILWVFSDVGDDIRVFLIAMLAVVLSHAVLIFNWIKFDASYLSFTRSLKISKIKRLSYWLILLLILMIPELTLFAWLTHFNLLQLGSAIIFSLATLFSLFTLVYLLKADMERYMKWLLFFFFTSMLAVLAGYYFVFSVGLLLASIVQYLFYYSKLDTKELA